MKRPYLAPKDDGGSSRVVSVDLGKRGRASAPWDQSGPKPASRNARSAARTAPPEPPQDTSGLSIDPDASASEYSQEDSKSFWSLPAVPATQVPSASPPSDAVALSGPAEAFDVATGWNFPAVGFEDELKPDLALSDAERAAPVLPTADELFSGPSDAPDWAKHSTPARQAVTSSPPSPAGRPAPQPSRPAPQPSAPVDVEALLTQGRELLSSGELERAVRLLRRAGRAAPDNNSVATWLDFAERRLMREHLPNARADSVPTPTQNRRHLATQASPVERQMLSAVDGVRNLKSILGAGNDEAFVPMLKLLASFEARGWITWA